MTHCEQVHVLINSAVIYYSNSINEMSLIIHVENMFDLITDSVGSECFFVLGIESLQEHIVKIDAVDLSTDMFFRLKTMKKIEHLEYCLLTANCDDSQQVCR